MDLIIQYSIIALVFIAALIYMVRRFMPAKKKTGGCAKGCGCSMSESGSGGS